MKSVLLLLGIIRGITLIETFDLSADKILPDGATVAIIS